MKTFEDCLNEVAASQGYENYAQACWKNRNKLYPYSTKTMTEAAFLYSSYKEDSAFSAGYGRGYSDGKQGKYPEFK